MWIDTCATCGTRGEMVGFRGNALTCARCSIYIDCGDCGRAVLATAATDVDGDGHRYCPTCAVPLAARLAWRVEDGRETEVVR